MFTIIKKVFTMAECCTRGSGGNKDCCVICRLEFEDSYVKVKEKCS